MAWRTRVSIVLVALILVGTVAYFLLLAAEFGRLPWASPPEAIPSSPSHHDLFHASHQNPWNELDDAEAAQVYAFLEDNPDQLHRPDSTTDHSVYLVELLRPNKSDVLHYLDDQGPAPPRWARVAMLETRADEAFFVDYMLGPLPVSNGTRLQPLTYCHNSGRHRVQGPFLDVAEFFDWALTVGENASDITKELLGATTNRDDPTDPDALVIALRFASADGGGTVQWLEFAGPGLGSDGRTLLPQGVYVQLNTATARPETWTAGQWFYNGILYDNDTVLRHAIASSDFEKLRLNLDGPWTDTEHFGPSIPERDRLPPLSIQPHGPRYHLDRAQNYLSWMGFSFYLSTAQATAVSLFDIRYNASRIIYELGLQEALSHYAGNEPLQSGLVFLDTFFGMGSRMFSLVPGLDCPGHAEYLDMSYHKAGQTYTNKNAICVFEYTSDAPLQRHVSASSATVSRNTYLVVRSVSTVDNYDYTIDYIFYLDGSIEVKLRASGFIFAAFHAEPRSSPLARDESTNEYGFRIHPGVHTSMHDHVISFRADLDICGTKNTLVHTSIEPLAQTYAWDKPEVSGPRNTMHMVHAPLRKETGLNWPHNGAGMYLVTAPNVANKWGETRAYRILPGTGMGNPVHLTIRNSTALGRSAAWSAADLWVLRNHPDTEPAAAHPWNYLDPQVPLVDFAQMVDDEDIENEDLVLYFTLGGHHVPNTQDIPNTLMHTSASSVMFSPFNYFDHDVSRAVRQGARIDRRPRPPQQQSSLDKDEAGRSPPPRPRVAPAANDKKGGDGVSYFGARYTGPFQVPIEDLSPDLSHYMEERDQGEPASLMGLFAGQRPDNDRRRGS